MNKFNLCEAFFSGYYFFREEFASCALGYMLSPFSTGKVEPLRTFIEQLLATTQGKNHALLEEALEKLNEPDLTWENSFVAEPLTGKTDIASAVEFQEIDILLRIGEVVLLFENKIYDGSVGNIAQQIRNYVKALPERYKDKTVPIAIYPQCAKKFEDIAAVSWNGSDEFVLRDFFADMAVKYKSLEDFVHLIKGGFSSDSRMVVPPQQAYDVLVNKFDGDFPEIIRQVIPLENFSPGNDMFNGGCLLYRLPLENTGGECFPFRLVVNGKCEILYQGLRKSVFLSGKTFDGKHTVRDIIRLMLEKRGVKFTTRFHFSYKEFAKAETRQAFNEVLELLNEIDRSQWSEDDFDEKYRSLTDTKVTLNDLQGVLDKEFLEQYKDKLQKNPTRLYELVRVLKTIGTVLNTE